MNDLFEKKKVKIPEAFEFPKVPIVYNNYKCSDYYLSLSDPVIGGILNSKEMDLPFELASKID